MEVRAHLVGLFNWRLVVAAVSLTFNLSLLNMSLCHQCTVCGSWPLLRPSSSSGVHITCVSAVLSRSQTTHMSCPFHAFCLISLICSRTWQWRRLHLCRWRRHNQVRSWTTRRPSQVSSHIWCLYQWHAHTVTDDICTCWNYSYSRSNVQTFTSCSNVHQHAEITFRE